jgi:hypothetical protein
LTAIALLFKQRRKVLNSEVVPGSRPAAFAAATDPRVEIFRRIGIGCQRLCGRQPNGEAPGYAARNGRQLTDNKASGSGSRRSTPYQPRSYRVSKATLWPSTNPRSPGRSRMARASLIQFSSGSHSSADLQSVHARKHSAFAAALILAFVAKNPSYRIVQAEQTPPFVELCDYEQLRSRDVLR